MTVLAHPLSSHNCKNIYFGDPVRNCLLSDGTFSRIIYSDDTCALNGVSLKLSFRHARFERHYGRTRFHFDANANAESMEQICNIEQTILSMIGIQHKSPVYGIREQLEMSSIEYKSSDGSPCDIVLKIAGIWESTSQYGIAYKFFKVNVA